MRNSKKVICGQTCFRCVPNDAWLNERACQDNQEAALSAVKMLSHFHTFLIPDAALDRLSECCRCEKFMALSESEFMNTIKADVIILLDKIENLDMTKGDAQQDKKRARWRRWYYRQKKLREGQNANSNT